MELDVYSNNIFLVVLPFAFTLITGIFLFNALYIRNTFNKRRLKKEYYQNLESERNHIANELHDSTGAFIVSLRKFISDQGSFKDTENASKWEAKLTRFQDFILNINNKLYPVELDSGDIVEAIKSLSDLLESKSCTIDVQCNE